LPIFHTYIALASRLRFTIQVVQPNIQAMSKVVKGAGGKAGKDPKNTANVSHETQAAATVNMATPDVK
jgi:hypothetical protein